MVKLEFDGGSYVIPATDVEQLFDVIEDYDDLENVEYTLTFMTTDKEKFEALPEFNG